ncbi:Dimer_Tnp_hAT domain-containing protein [Cephalotus follicularis]|uniref:Dimer_Tnp_hAT domain-containing protein n=1 Tax=Cephalotus follicularis TaxID=3775 RepID=A0A1Q3B0I1_CEPFO|nr:Dimer_Tnp_hAT domain-containing protein [Cephalotus follicularis]
MRSILDSIHSFDFAFTLHLMRSILAITNELSQALQRKDQDIVNAMTLVKVSKQRLQLFRDEEVSLFCTKHHIVILDMDDMFAILGRPRRRVEQMTNLHHYQVELFYSVIDMQLQELITRFNKVTTELLLCMACLNPSDSFSAFDKHKLIRFAQFYESNFSSVELMVLDDQLETYIIDMRSCNDCFELKEIGDLAKKLVDQKKHIVYPLVYKLMKFALILPVATATVERVFSAMKVVKNQLRNCMRYKWMNDCLVTYIEKDIFDTIDNEKIIKRFQNMKNRRGQL